MAFSIFSRPSKADPIPLLPLHTAPAPTNTKGPVFSQASRNMTSSSLLQPESLLALSRQDAHLQAQLQDLLDAQSEGLLAGLGADHASSTGSRTPTTADSDFGARSASRPRSVVMPIRQPKPKKIGLRSARRGIGRTMSDLARIKDEEARVLEEELEKRDDCVTSIDRISAKSEGLRQQIETIEQEPANTRIAELKGTEKALGTEIHDLETRLYEMKARQRHLLREIQGAENSVQSKLSSYKNALQLAEKEARDFLARPPYQETSRKGEGVWALPAPRRTLEMAREQFVDERTGLGSHIQGVSREREALEEGGKVWGDVVREVSDVEGLLQVEMRALQIQREGRRAEEGMRSILERMRVAQRSIEDSLHNAEKRDWKLLVCCIGAELEALIEGQGVLREAFRASGMHVELEEHPPDSQKARFEPGASLVDTNGSVERSENRSEERSEDEDDGPGPDLLISQDET